MFSSPMGGIGCFTSVGLRRVSTSSGKKWMSQLRRQKHAFSRVRPPSPAPWYSHVVCELAGSGSRCWENSLAWNGVIKLYTKKRRKKKILETKSERKETENKQKGREKRLGLVLPHVPVSKKFKIHAFLPCMTCLNLTKLDFANGYFEPFVKIP